MKFYKLAMDMNRPNDVVCHYENDFGIQQNEFQIAKKYSNWDGKFYFTFDKREGDTLTDYLANDKGWFVVSIRLKQLLDNMNTNIQFLPVQVIETSSSQKYEYYIANVLELVDALCLEKSEYFETEIPELGTIYTVSKFAIYESKVQNIDVFKLANRQEIPIFVSETFKEIIEKNDITGIELREIRVA